MNFFIEQTLSKPTVQFGLRASDYLVLLVIGVAGNFFIPKLWLATIMLALIIFFRYVNTTKPRYFWSSWFIWLSNTNLSFRPERRLPPIIRR
jgi:hypothetical protein